MGEALGRRIMMYLIAALGLIILVLLAVLLRMKWQAALSESQNSINQLRQQLGIEQERARRIGNALSGLALRDRPNKANEFVVKIPKAKFDQAPNWSSRSRIEKRGGLELTFVKNESKGKKS